MGEINKSIAGVTKETVLKFYYSALRSNAQQLDLKTIDKLCNLFNCEIRELISKHHMMPKKDSGGK
ncbi:helix-turn-helix domain-containing protein [Pseudoalteromonas rhizosphaerae]|uniref:helix-turn-helix domain-containing protein n=1 Tax=Pseudoalteromonas rhizosphaerae TaxID=2518973 RepID=UPI003CE5AD0A